MRKRSRARSSWLAVWGDACSLGFEASSVIGLRAMKLAIGGKAADTEAQRMVSEKIEASLALQAKVMSGRPVAGASPRENARPLSEKGAREPDTPCQRSRWTAHRPKRKPVTR